MKPLATLLTALFLFIPPCNSDEISLIADRWCPVNCEVNSKKPGIMIEIAQAIFAQSGHQINYQIVPWARAVKDVRNNKSNAIVGAFISDAPDFIFPANPLMMISSSAFFAKTDSAWSYSTINSLSKITLGAVRGYDYGDKLNQYIRQGQGIELLSGKNALQRNIIKLLIGRVDIIVEAAPVFWHMANKLAITNQVKQVGEATAPEGCYIAFSPNNPHSKKYAAILSNGVAALRKSGELQ